MKTFKNALFVKRDYECTNVIFCQAEEAPADNWIECKEEEIERWNCKPLYIQDEVRYFGYL